MNNDTGSVALLSERDRILARLMLYVNSRDVVCKQSFTSDIRLLHKGRQWRRAGSLRPHGR